jgi:hypothetical protein
MLLSGATALDQNMNLNRCGYRAIEYLAYKCLQIRKESSVCKRAGKNTKYFQLLNLSICLQVFN